MGMGGSVYSSDDTFDRSETKARCCGAGAWSWGGEPDASLVLRGCQGPRTCQAVLSPLAFGLT